MKCMYVTTVYVHVLYKLVYRLFYKCIIIYVITCAKQPIKFMWAGGYYFYYVKYYYCIIQHQISQKNSRKPSNKSLFR